MAAPLRSQVLFLLNVLIITLVVGAVLHTVAPYFERPDPRRVEVENAATEVQVINADKVPGMLKGKRSMLVLYASWCGPCRAEMPKLVEMMKRHELGDRQAIFLSVDNEALALAGFLVHGDIFGQFTPYLVHPHTQSRLASLLKGSGSSYRNIIPYVGFFDAEGRLTHEFTGPASSSALTQAATK